MIPRSLWKQSIIQEAKRLGFTAVGVSKAEFLADEAPTLENWLKQGYQGKMSYMENHFDKRLDPTKLVPGAKTVISFLFNYYSESHQNQDSPKLSMYAFGEDYHYVVKDHLRQLLEFIVEEIGSIQGRIFVDSAPVLERAWAQKSGLGWIGKNGNLISKQKGSYFFLAELISDLDLEPDSQINTYCGTCTACIDACPTNAILPGAIDGSRCISYLTIELKDSVLPNEFADKMDDWMFGCDVCQQVCPWNRFSTPNHESRFSPKPELLQMNTKDWKELTQEVFQELFRHSAVKRTKYEGLMRNINFVTNKKS